MKLFETYQVDLKATTERLERTRLACQLAAGKLKTLTSFKIEFDRNFFTRASHSLHASRMRSSRSVVLVS
jgi:hypothetical protein